ncbi:MAG TPA: hypothetical protein VK668_15600 [Mucilaginibacter sp.]|nr:hypothetical protein [Mucilaginibacter sp.]
MKTKLTSALLLASLFVVLCTSCAPRHIAPPPAPPGAPAPPSR